MVRFGTEEKLRLPTRVSHDTQVAGSRPDTGGNGTLLFLHQGILQHF